MIWIRCKELAKLSYVERRIHNCKYYLDGTPKRGPNKPKEDEKLYLVQALLHKYNEDHNIFGVWSFFLPTLPPPLLELEALSY